MPVNLSIGFLSYFTSTLLFLGILILAFIGQKNLSKAKPFFLLISSTLIWSALLTMSQIGASLAIEMIFIAELLRYFTWFYVLHHLIDFRQKITLEISIANLFSPLFISILFAISFLTLLFHAPILAFFGIDNPNIIQIFWMLIFSISGLILVEHLYRNTSSELRWAINFMCISAGAVFIFDFFVFSNAILIQKLDYEYWSARGIINVLIAPTLLISAARNPSLSPNIHISRQFVFHSSTLLGSGAYLILMSLAGYYIKVVSGDWGDLLQATFLFAAFLLLASLFFSSTVKAKIKQYISRSFSNKYDYREEWNRFSDTLLNNDASLSIALRSLQAICQIVNSQGAQLWLKDNNKFFYRANWHMPITPTDPEPENSPFIQYIIKTHDLFTTEDINNSNPVGLENNHWFINDEKSWLILPLWVDKNLYGFIHLQTPMISMKLDSEDKELLTTITHHVALYLSQNEISLALQQAEKFKSMNQMTAFLTHDLKTLLSQLFLLVENGKVHKDNPAFIEDMLNTLEHVSQKMQKLVQQLKEPENTRTSSHFNLLEIIEDILTDYKHNQIKPELINSENLNPVISASKSEFRSALKHIIQNATESVSKKGFVKVELSSNKTDYISIIIKDNGKGMSADFIANRLFQPFDSTKGVSGMGIGVYQSREYIRSLKGDIQVSSQEGTGTTFTIKIPIQST